MAALNSPRYLTHLTFLKTHHTTSSYRRTTLPPSLKTRRHSSTPMASTTTDTAAEVPTTSDVIVQYVVLRRDLIDTWPLGSVVTQGCHASVAAIWTHKDDPQTIEYCNPDNIDSMHKVTLEVKGEVQLKNLSEKLTSNDIDHKLWIEQPENYPTCLATKPYPKSLVSMFFKKLKLYMVQEDEDEDVQVDARGKKKVTGGKKPRENWPPEQEVALTKAWIQVSECKKFGNEQKAEGFWKRVLEHYKTTLGSTSRTFHSLNTKWKTMNAAMGVFNGYYLQAKRAKASGCSDLDVMKTAIADYQRKTKKKFGHMLAWEVVNGHDEWEEQDCFQEFGGSASNDKRKLGEYESASNDNIIPDIDEDPIPPIDSKKPKKKQVTSSSSVASVADDISSYVQRKTRYLDEKRENDKFAASLLATQLDGARFKNRQREMKFFFEPHDHITDPVHLEIILADKREIAKKHRWQCDF